MTRAQLVHFLDTNAVTAQAACGTWEHSTNWTTDRHAVTCPECLRVLADRDEASVTEGYWFSRK